MVWHRRRARWSAVAGASLFALTWAVVTAVGVWGDVWLTEAVAYPLCAVAAWALTGVAGMVNARRMQKVLAHGPWVACRAEVFSPRWAGGKVVLRDPATSELRAYVVVTVAQRMHLVEPGPVGELWWREGPDGRGVVSRPGGRGLVWLRPVALGSAGRRAMERAVERGILDRPQPSDAPRSPAVGRPVVGSVTGTGHETPTPRRRRVLTWWPVVPLLLGLTSFFLSGMWYEASKNDPQVDLRVVSLQGNGDCIVEFVDPRDGTYRQAPFRCVQTPGPNLEHWEVGWMVSYGPWEGDLYNPNFEGTPANDVDDVLGITGLALLGVALVGGVALGVRGLLARCGRPSGVAEVPAAPVPVRLEKSATGSGEGRVSEEVSYDEFSYAAVAEAARRRTAPGEAGSSPRAEADIRRVPWWRVRSLQEVAQLRQLTAGAGITGAAVAAWWLWGSWLGPSVVVCGAFGALGMLLAAWRARYGLPVARELAQAARGPVPHPRRYVLLHDPHDDAPTLLVFSTDGGADATPEATLAVNAPAGSRRNPHSGLPAPVGVADLRALPDGRGPVDGATVVPWVADRPLWPQHTFTSVDLDDPEDRAHLEGLVRGIPVFLEDDAARRAP